MLNPDVYIRELELLIDQQVEYVLSRAAEWPEDPEAWNRVLQRYHVRPNESRGPSTFHAVAPVAEVRRALAAIRELASPALAHIEVQFGQEIASRLPLAARVSRLRARVYSLETLADGIMGTGATAGLPLSRRRGFAAGA